MLPLTHYLSFAWLMAGLYATGFAVASPPLAWGGLAVGWWLNRGQPVAPRLAGALLAAVVGAYLAMSWQDVVQHHPAADAGTLLAAFGEELALPFTLLRAGAVNGDANGAVIFALIYLPALLALLLYGLARRYDEGIDGWLSRLREGRAERGQARAEKRAERHRARADRRALVPAAGVPVADFEAGSCPAVPATGGAVLSARSGEPVTLPAGLVMDGEVRPGFIVIHVEALAPPAPVVLPRYGRGYIVGTCIAVYYLAATASRLWLPLLALGLWFFGPSLLAYEQHQLADMLTNAARGIHLW